MISDIIGELKGIYTFDPVTIIELKSYIIPVAVIVAIALMFWIMSMHGHQFMMTSEPVPFSSGYHANGDASIFGPDGFHFRNE